MTQRTKWNNNYELARIYYEEHKNLLIPTDYVVNGVNLGTWLLRQRILYRCDKLPFDRVKKLESIGIEWHDARKIKFDSSWDEKYNLAKKYYIEHNDLLIAQNYVIDGVKLGSWISRQRELYKNHELPEDKVKKLESIGMDWYNARELLFENIWNNNYELARNYYLEHKNLLIKKSYIVDNINLGSWLARQCNEYTKDKLSKERIIKLENINIVWNTHKENLLKQLKKEKKFENKKDLIEALINLYSEESVKNIFYYIDECDDVSLINELLKTYLPHEYYQIFILYLMGLNHQNLSKIYNISIQEIEKIRFISFKILIKLYNIYNHNVKKKVKNGK